MTGPLVSIITITRNREKLIQRAINSVLRQTYSNIEYIIVDGASTDNTSRVVHSIPDDRIKFIELKENFADWPKQSILVLENRMENISPF